MILVSCPRFLWTAICQRGDRVMKAMRPEIEGTDVAAAPVVSEGGRSPSTLSIGLPGMTPNPSTIGPLAPGQRWSVGRKRWRSCCACLAASPWSFYRGSLACRSTSSNNGGRRRTPPWTWALKERESDPASGELAAAMQRIGELSMEVELLRARIGGVPALWPAGGRGDGRGDVPDHRPPLWPWPGSAISGTSRAHSLCRAPAARR